jgi:hypothetical protein
MHSHVSLRRSGVRSSLAALFDTQSDRVSIVVLYRFAAATARASSSERCGNQSQFVYRKHTG